MNEKKVLCCLSQTNYYKNICLQNPYDFNIIYFRYCLEIKLKMIMETIYISEELLIFYLEIWQSL